MLFRSNPMDLLILVPLFIISIGLHESAHAYAAHFLGDPTPEREGRLTVNPIVHLDLFGTIMLLMVGFGWGRSVNVEPRNLKHPLRDMSLIAAAGPASNLILAVLSVLGLVLAHYNNSFAFLNEALAISASLNFFLMFLNLVPIPPLDGAKVLRSFLPKNLGLQFDSWEPYGPILFLALIMLPGISTVFMGGIRSLTYGSIGLLTQLFGI